MTDLNMISQFYFVSFITIFWPTIEAIMVGLLSLLVIKFLFVFSENLF